MQVTVRQVNGFDVHQDERGEVLQVVPRTPAPSLPKVPRSQEEYQALSQTERRAIHSRMLKSTKPMTFGDFVEQMDGIQETLVKNFTDLVAKINAQSVRIAELEKRPIPKFVSVLRPQPESDDE